MAAAGLTREAVLAALAQVKDPELHKSLVELDMIRDVSVDAGGKVDITVVMAVPEAYLQHTVAADVQAALQAVDGVSAIEVQLEVMDDAERERLLQKLRVEDGAGGSPLLSGKSTTQFIAVASGKGGVGKSTVAVNLAVALAERGRRVGLMDCDIYGFSVPGMMGIDRTPTVLEDLVLPVPAHGVSVISMEFFLQDNRPVIWRGPMLGKMLQQFFDRVYWGDLDYLVLDLPPGTGDVALDVHRLLPDSREIVVTTPHPTATHVAYRAGRMAIDTGHAVIGVVENMSHFRAPDTGQIYRVFGQGGGDELAALLEVPLLARLPLGEEQLPGTALFAPGTEAYAAMAQVAAVCDRAGVTAASAGQAGDGAED